MMPDTVDRMLAVLPDHLRAGAAVRLARHAPVLRRLLAGLYGQRADFDAWLAELMETLGRLHAARPAPLHALDARRAAQPGWFLDQRMLGYCAYVQNFGGDLPGVARRIPYLRELGVTYLHLLPFLRARAGENDGGFAVTSFDEVEPALGTNVDLEALTGQLREAGISLCSDFILNHVADDHEWSLGARAGDAAMRAMFHVFPDRTMPDRYERTLGQVFPQVAPGNFVAALDGWVWSTFYPYQWDLNYANPAVFAGMAAALLRLANRGVEVFRLDSTAFLWKREGTTSMNQPEAHQLLQALRAIVDIVAPGVLLKAEAIVATSELPAYLGSLAAPECHIAYHSSLMAAGWAALAEQHTGMLRQVIAATPALPPAASWLSYVRCHDDIGWNVLRAEAASNHDANGRARLARVSQFFSGVGGTGDAGDAGGAGASYAAGATFQSSDPDAAHGSNGMAAALAGLTRAGDAAERALALRRVLLLHGLALCFGALPVLYMGDELAQQNDDDYIHRPAHAMDSRWLQRPVLDEALLASRHDDASVAGQMFAALQALLRARRAHHGFAADAPRTLVASDKGMLALARGAGLLVLLNFSGQVQTHALDGDWFDSTGSTGSAAWQNQATLPPYGMLWLQRSPVTGTPT